MSETTDADEFAPRVSIDELDCIGDTLRKRLKNKGIETRIDLHDYRRRVRGLWWDTVSGIGEYTAEQIEDEFQELAFANE